MRVKTFFVYLPDLDIAFDQEKQSIFQTELDANVGFAKTVIDVNETPFNKTTSFTVAVWALGISEEENVDIIRKVEQFLNKKQILYKEHESYIEYNEGGIYIEVESPPSKKITQFRSREAIEL